MATRTPLRDVCNRLPRFDGPPFQPERSDPSFELLVRENPGYVWPDLQVEENPDEHHILLVTAPGAMGKSAAARAVAHALNSPLVDLAQVRVGSASLTGLLTRVLGWTETPRFIEALNTGHASLVMDSLDEAQLAAGRDHFIAFLSNVAEIIERARPAGQVIVFGRHDAFETADLTFEMAGLKVCRASITPLTHRQSSELIDLSLDSKLTAGPSYNVHRIHSEPFARMRDEVFLDIANALGSVATSAELAWPEVESFLGYPPVLLVLSERLKVDNPSSPENRSGARLQSTPLPQSAQRGNLLKRVIEGILDRETNKVRDQVSRTLGLSSSEARLLYGREEQALRLISRISGMPVQIVPPVGIDNEKRGMYEELVSPFVPDHPFLSEQSFANVVFSDYIRAFAASSPLQRAFDESL